MACQRCGMEGRGGVFDIVFLLLLPPRWEPGVTGWSWGLAGVERVGV